MASHCALVRTLWTLAVIIGHGLPAKVQAVVLPQPRESVDPILSGTSSFPARRPVWFEHFSRAGGTTICAHAIFNGLRTGNLLEKKNPKNVFATKKRPECKDPLFRLSLLNKAPLNHTQLMQKLVGPDGHPAMEYFENEDFPMSFGSPETSQDFFYVTMLREPEARYQSLMEHKTWGSPLYYQNGNKDNEYTRHLTGDASIEGVASVNDTHYERALRNLEHFGLVLIFEEFDRSLELLKCKLGWCVDRRTNISSTGNELQPAEYAKDPCSNQNLMQGESHVYLMDEIDEDGGGTVEPDGARTGESDPSVAAADNVGVSGGGDAPSEGAQRRRHHHHHEHHHHDHAAEKLAASRPWKPEDVRFDKLLYARGRQLFDASLSECGII